MQKSVNPFINKLVVPYIQYITDIHKVTLLSDDKYGYEVESEHFTRVYVSKEKRQFIFTQLSMYARDMLMAMQYFTHPSHETVILTHEKMQDLYGTAYSKRRFDDTIRELVKMAIIDYKDRKKGEFWYDPQFFASGNRLAMFEQCKVKVATKYSSVKKLSNQ
jgi:hypothetical protein